MHCISYVNPSKLNSGKTSIQCHLGLLTEKNIDTKIDKQNISILQDDLFNSQSTKIINSIQKEIHFYSYTYNSLYILDCNLSI